MDEMDFEHACNFLFLQIRKLGFKEEPWEIPYATLANLIHSATGCVDLHTLLCGGH